MCTLRQERTPGPARIGPVLGPAPSTGHRVLVRHGLHRLAFLDRPAGQVIRRHERARPGELVHVDLKKLGRVRPGAARVGRASVSDLAGRPGRAGRVGPGRRSEGPGRGGRRLPAVPGLRRGTR
ncbi:hypothetical protein GCM10010406_51350 [Streptomyces thermolineatus]|uniref:Uncharacterized protein n=1 Tax=Streptomyces thermolineatus TaxID=44033 RepID=A0ABN3MTL5_9ACTN